MNSEYIFKVEPKGFASGLDVEWCVRERVEERVDKEDS